MPRSRSWELLLTAAALMLGLVAGSPGRAADPGDEREHEVYEALHQVDLLAAAEANEAYPALDFVEGEVEMIGVYIEKRRAFQEERKSRGRDEVAGRFDLTINQVEAIRRRGDAERWPLSDDPSLEPESHAADYAAAGLLAISTMLLCCGLVYGVRRRHSLLVQAQAVAVAAWRRYVRSTRSR